MPTKSTFQSLKSSKSPKLSGLPAQSAAWGPEDNQKLLALLSRGAFTTSNKEKNCDTAQAYLAPHRGKKYFRAFIRKKFSQIKWGEELDGAIEVS